MWLKEQNKRINEGKGLAKSLSGRKLVSDKAECIFFFDFSEHANRERQGPVPMWTPKDASR